jgi:hypothetical protein
MPVFSHAAEWQTPTPEELKMTAEPAAPNAAAVYLYREETSDDNLHMHSIYVRLKILTEEGKKYADVEIPYEARGYSIANVEGRTIHADGTVIPFNSKPYDKLVVKSATMKRQAKVFSMPDVQVGSILEYKYILRYDDERLFPPTWYIQTDLYLRKAHYRYIPYEGANFVITGRGQTAATLTWLPILPAGVTVQHIQPPPTGSMQRVMHSYVVDVEHIAPAPDEEYLPPIHSLSYRVYFLYSAYDKEEEFWKKEGKYWSKQADKFMDAKDALNAMVNQLTAPGDTQEVKLQKIYAGVMAFENSDFTREHTEHEDKLQGFRTVKTAEDIIARKRGNSDELTLLFVGLARAAGMKAYVMAVTNRDENIFLNHLMNMDQLDDDIAIVNVGGKEQFFDPGERYCAYGQLEWRHTMAGGLRQTDNGTAIAYTPDNPFTDSKTVRIATLTMGEDGHVEGMIRVGYTGEPALRWRQRGLRADEEEVERDMEEDMRRELPGGLNVKVDKVLYLDDPTKQLVASFTVDGPLGTATAKRVFVPVEIFKANERPMFTEPKREQPVYFHYAYQETDQVNMTYPPSMTLESAPAQDQIMMEKFAVLQEGASSKGNMLRLTRDFALGTVIFKTEEFPELRTFYAKVIHKDQEPVVLKMAGHDAGN